jgi:hypothetical protein
VALKKLSYLFWGAQPCYVTTILKYSLGDFLHYALYENLSMGFFILFHFCKVAWFFFDTYIMHM